MFGVRSPVDLRSVLTLNTIYTRESTPYVYLVYSTKHTLAIITTEPFFQEKQERGYTLGKNQIIDLCELIFFNVPLFRGRMHAYRITREILQYTHSLGMNSRGDFPQTKTTKMVALFG